MINKIHFILKVTDESSTSMISDDCGGWCREGHYWADRTVKIHSIHISQSEAEERLSGLSAVSEEIRCDANDPKSPIEYRAYSSFVILSLNIGDDMADCQAKVVREYCRE